MFLCVRQERQYLSRAFDTAVPTAREALTWNLAACPLDKPQRRDFADLHLGKEDSMPPDNSRNPFIIQSSVGDRFLANGVSPFVQWVQG